MNALGVVHSRQWLTDSQRKAYLGQMCRHLHTRAAVLTGHEKGTQAEVRQTAPHVNFTNLINRRKWIASRGIEPEFDCLLQEVVNMTKLIKPRAFSSQLCALLCKLV